MQKFQLEILFHIIGIGSASGLFYKDHSVFLISDNSGYLYEYKTDTKALEKTLVFETDTPQNIPKKLKPDFEALASHGDSLFVFGSGSTENRNKMATINRTTQTISMTDIADLYLTMQSFGNIKPENFNIEGVVYTGENWYFFQRGNGKDAKNGVFTISGQNLTNSFMMVYNEIKLPKIKGIRSTFTDAVMVNKTIYFLAAAENSESTYQDGEVMGSLIGTLDVDTMKVTSTQVITETHKFEGITLSEMDESKITFLLCEDNDTEALESDIYKLTVPRKYP